MKYPHEFLGRCQTCLDNASLSNTPCRLAREHYGLNGYLLNGMLMNDEDCLIRQAQAAYRREHHETSGTIKSSTGSTTT